MYPPACQEGSLVRSALELLLFVLGRCEAESVDEREIFYQKERQERFPHLKRCEVGTHVRVLDTPLKGLRHQPRAVVSEFLEVFLVVNDKSVKQA